MCSYPKLLEPRDHHFGDSVRVVGTDGLAIHDDAAAYVRVQPRIHRIDDIEDDFGLHVVLNCAMSQDGFGELRRSVLRVVLDILNNHRI